MRRNRWWLPVLSLAMVLYCGLGFAQQSEELQDIRAQIKQKQAQIDKQLADAKVLQDQLKAAELNISNTAKLLDQTQTKLASNLAEQERLEKQQSEIQGQISQQQKALAGQLKSMYMAGDYDFAKMLFNMDEAAKLERTMSYYQYLTAARKAQIDRFRLLVDQLKQVTAQLAKNQTELESLEQKQQQQRTQLVQQQSLRQATLVKIEKKIDSEAAQIEQLQINEQALVKAIEQAQQDADKGPLALNGLAKLKGQLFLPTQGKMRNMFGRIRQGQIKWKGILFSGNTGAPVRAVYDGRVLYADWLRGFGLVTVLDHGDGYMSLYGHNQALLKQVGDDVQVGETIALVGQSGGQSTPNLYFEIRHKGTPVNPTYWLKR